MIYHISFKTNMICIYISGLPQETSSRLNQIYIVRENINNIFLFVSIPNDWKFLTNLNCRLWYFFTCNSHFFSSKALFQNFMYFPRNFVKTSRNFALTNRKFLKKQTRLHRILFWNPTYSTIVVGKMYKIKCINSIFLLLFRGKEDFNIDCMDPLGRTALSIAIINENPGTRHINQWKWTIPGNQPMEMNYRRKSTNGYWISYYCLPIGSRNPRFIAKIFVILPKPTRRTRERPGPYSSTVTVTR